MRDLIAKDVGDNVGLELTIWSHGVGQIKRNGEICGFLVETIIMLANVKSRNI